MNLTEIKELFENVSNGKITEKNKEDASTLLTALKDAEENLKLKKILIQIDPDDDFGIDETQSYKVEKT